MAGMPTVVLSRATVIERNTSITSLVTGLYHSTGQPLPFIPGPFPIPNDDDDDDDDDGIIAAATAAAATAARAATDDGLLSSGFRQ